MVSGVIQRVPGSAKNLGLPAAVAANEPIKTGGAACKLWLSADDPADYTLDAGSGRQASWRDKITGTQFLPPNPATTGPIKGVNSAGQTLFYGDGVGAYLEGPVPAGVPIGTDESWLLFIIDGKDTVNAITTIGGYGGANPLSLRRSLRRTGTDHPSAITANPAFIDGNSNMTGRHAVGLHYYGGGHNVDFWFDGKITAQFAAIATPFATTATKLRLFGSVDNPAVNFTLAGIRDFLIFSALTADQFNYIFNVWAVDRAGRLI